MMIIGEVIKMKNKYSDRYGFFDEDQFMADLINTIKTDGTFDKFETLLINSFLRDGCLEENVFRILLTFIKLASGEYTIEMLTAEFKKEIRESKEQRF